MNHHFSMHTAFKMCVIIKIIFNYAYSKSGLTGLDVYYEVNAF